jgi:hypothetical protein
MQHLPVPEFTNAERDMNVGGNCVETHDQDVIRQYACSCFPNRRRCSKSRSSSEQTQKASNLAMLSGVSDRQDVTRQQRETVDAPRRLRGRTLPIASPVAAPGLASRAC